MTSSDGVKAQRLWDLIEAARRQVPDSTDGSAVAARTASLLSAYPREELLADRLLWSLMADSWNSRAAHSRSDTRTWTRMGLRFRRSAEM